MKEYFISLLKGVFTKFSPVPRTIIYLIDSSVVLLSVVFAYYLRFNFAIPVKEESFFTISIIAVVLIRLITYHFLSFHQGIVRFTSLQDIERILLVIFLSSIIIFILSSVSRFVFSLAIIPLSVIIIDFLLVSIFTITYRLAVKGLYLALTNPIHDKNAVAIFGGKIFCTSVKAVLDSEPNAKMIVKAFLTNNRLLKNSTINNVSFYHLNSLEKLITHKKIKSVIFSEPFTNLETKNHITDVCLKNNVKSILVPGIHKVFNGELTYSQFREIKVEDLLDRKPIKVDITNVSNDIAGKTILITGAAGSIGSEIVRQLVPFHPKKLILMDHAETPLFDIIQTLRRDLKYSAFEKIIGCITNEIKVNQLFTEYKPDIVYHAAAYKHVPMMEKYPDEAIRVNILGTKIIADNALKSGATKFVMISTDKAVNPTNVMGASKRIAEIYCQSLNLYKKTAFIITRFGNVIGSNGSVIPTFREQIKSGGPVTITHPDITRYFMSIPEACQLVLQAGAMGEQNEIFIFDMGKPVKIYDLACKMIRLSGFKVDVEIKINFTGLRPGEKLFEELLSAREKTIETYHPRIMIAKSELSDVEQVVKMIRKLVAGFHNMDHFEMVRYMKEIVPEYISQNSVFEILDNTPAKVIMEKTN